MLTYVYLYVRVRVRVLARCVCVCVCVNVWFPMHYTIPCYTKVWSLVYYYVIVY